MTNDKANSDLMDAAVRGDVKAASLALAAGADVNARSLEGDTAIHLAARQDMIEAYARTYAAKLTPATAPKAVAAVRSRADKVADGDIHLESPELPVYRLPGRMLRIFTSGLADSLERRFVAADRDNPPHDFRGVVKLLIEHGANVKIPNAFNETPIDWTYMTEGQVASLLRQAALSHARHAERARRSRGDGGRDGQQQR